MRDNTINGQSAAKPLNSTEQEERSTTSQIDVGSSDPKRSASIIKIEEDIVWTLNENLERFNKKYNFIYKTTNIINNRFYIGRHSTNKLKDDYIGSGTILKRSIKKYGLENFKFEILYFCKNFKDLVLLEKKVVDKHMIKNELCINICEGGLSPILYGKDNGNFGNRWTDAMKKSLSLKKTGKSSGILNPFYGKKHSEETVRILSKKCPNFGENNGFYNKHHSEESKNKIIKGIKEFHKNNPELRARLRAKKLQGLYYTPKGVFETALEASFGNKCSKSSILKRCKKDNDKITGMKYNTPNEYKSLDKTWRDFGFYFIKSDDN